MIALAKGDYVLATKYSDGDRADAWCIGWFDQKDGDRFIVVDAADNRFRYSGFRRCEKITHEVGVWLCQVIPVLEGCPPWTVNIWSLLTNAIKEPTNDAG